MNELTLVMSTVSEYCLKYAGMRAEEDVDRGIAITWVRNTGLKHRTKLVIHYNNIREKINHTLFFRRLGRNLFMSSLVGTSLALWS